MSYEKAFLYIFSSYFFIRNRVTRDVSDDRTLYNTEYNNQQIKHVRTSVK